MADAVRTELVGEVAVLTVNNPPLNLLGTEVRCGLHAAIARAEEDPSVRALVIRCAGRTFCAGFDITEFGQPLLAPTLRDVVDRIEACSKPIVAALHGTALGGGLELAMACHGRVAAPGSRLGLVEVKLGLLPGCGGTQRLPRLVDVGLAAHMTAGGQTLHAYRALEEGLVDAVSGELEAAALTLAKALARRGAAVTSHLPTRSSPAASQSSAALDAQIRRIAKGWLAPAHCVAAVLASTQGTFECGLEREWQLFSELLESPQRAAQFHLFFAERSLARRLKGSAKQIWSVGGSTRVNWLDDFIQVQALLAGVQAASAVRSGFRADAAAVARAASMLGDSALSRDDVIHALDSAVANSAQADRTMELSLSSPERVVPVDTPAAGLRASVPIRVEVEAGSTCEAVLHVLPQPIGRRLVELRVTNPNLHSAAEKAAGEFFCASGWLVVPVTGSGTEWPSEQIRQSAAAARQLVSGGNLPDEGACDVLAAIAGDFPRHLGGPLYQELQVSKGEG